jgi:lipoprotein-anchoring transpeptidase ErfK/SrfK
MSFDKYKGYIGIAVVLTILVAAAIVISWKNYKDKFAAQTPVKTETEKTADKTPLEKPGELPKETITEKTEQTEPGKGLEKYASQLSGAKKLEEEKDLLGAKKEYERLLSSFSKPELLQKEIYRLNIALLFSPQVTAPPEGPKSEIYTVKASDTVEGIAKKFNTTVDLIKESNGIKDVKTIQIGNRYKVVTDEFSIIVSRSKNVLTLLAGDIVMKEYTVGTGEYDKTPLGDFKIRNKIPEPPWKGIPYGDPKNVLGTRWMGLINEGDTVQGYGIHGTWEPETVGKSVSQGCIRMVNEEVEELFKIMPVGAKVKIIE